MIAATLVKDNEAHCQYTSFLQASHVMYELGRGHFEHLFKFGEKRFLDSSHPDVFI